MIKVKDVKNAQAILAEKERNFAFQKADALKGLHVSFTGYSIAEGQEIYFPSAEELEKDPNKQLKIGLTQKGSTNKSALVRVNRKAPGSDTLREGWFNMSVLSRIAYDAEGKRIQIDEFREEMNSLNDDYDRFLACLNKKLVGTGIMSAYAPKFVDRKPALDEDGKRIYIPADYVTISMEDEE